MRKTIKNDILYFGVPALIVFFLGLILSGRDGYHGMVGTLWDLIIHPDHLHMLSGWNIAGLCLFIIGLTLAFVAAGTLKRFYLSTLMVREDHQLITHGVYQFARHPLYLGVLICIMGPPVYAPSLYGFLAMLLLVPIFLYRIKMDKVDPNVKTTDEQK